MQSIDDELRVERNRRRRERQRAARTPVEPICGIPRRRGPLLTFVRRRGTSIDVGRVPASRCAELMAAGFHPAPKRKWKVAQRRRRGAV
jgi:hypothetical protein